MIDNEFFDVKSTEYRGVNWVYTDSVKDLLIISGHIENTEKIVLIRQFRPPLNAHVISCPMGAFNPQSDKELMKLAKAEAEAESGHKVKWIKYLTSFARSPGMTNEVAHLFQAEYFNTYTGQNLHHDEDIEVLYISLKNINQELEGLRMAGNFLDSSVLYYYQPITIKPI